MADPYLTIVVPAYSEARRIEKSLVEIRRYIESRDFPVELVVVDDGSIDQTVKIVSRFPEVCILSNGRNRGKGITVRHDALEVRGKYTPFTDADLSAPIDEAERTGKRSSPRVRHGNWFASSATRVDWNSPAVAPGVGRTGLQPPRALVQRIAPA